MCSEIRRSYTEVASTALIEHARTGSQNSLIEEPVMQSGLIPLYT